MRVLHPLAATALVVFALCATLALSADLGRRDARAQFTAQGTPVLQVYTRGDAGSPLLDEKTVAAFCTVDGVRAAVAVTELPVTLSGLGWELPATVFAVPKDELKSLSLPLQSGVLPDSGRQAQALCGGALAEKLAEAVDRVGRPLPGSVHLTVEGGGTLDVQLSGVVQTAGNTRDDGLWLDEDVAQSLMLTEQQLDKLLPVTRAEIEVRSVSVASAVEEALQAQGYLVENPAEAQARTLTDGVAMTRQWGVLVALAFVLAVVTLWRKPPEHLMPALLVALSTAAVGVALAAVMMQTAMLMGARFFLSPDARYLLDAPRLLAVGLVVCAMVGIAHGLALRRNG